MVRACCAVVVVLVVVVVAVVVVVVAAVASVASVASEPVHLERRLRCKRLASASPHATRGVCWHVVAAERGRRDDQAHLLAQRYATLCCVALLAAVSRMFKPRSTTPTQLP